MEPREVFRDAFGRIRDGVRETLEGLSPEELAFRVDTQANSIAWLVWHLTRVQDDHVSEVAGSEQVWVAGGWAQLFGLELDVWDTGYGHKSKQVALVKASAELLGGYHDAVFEKTDQYLARVSAYALDQIVDRRFDPPVTLGVRLVSVIVDDLQHVGQAALLRGVVARARTGVRSG